MLRPLLLLGLLEGGLQQDELLYLAEGGVDAMVAVDLHCVDRRGQDSRTCVMLGVLDETRVSTNKKYSRIFANHIRS